MSQGEGFKHITVTAADEDDVIIVAGAPEAVPEEPVAVPEPKPVPEPEPEPAPEPEKPKPAEDVARKASQDAKRKAAQKPKLEGGYRETTLEDLQGKPMPLIQKIIIVAAIVCIIGAVIYCVAFMR